MSSPTTETNVENGARRRRSTFYVPLASDCVRAPNGKSEPRRTHSTVTRKGSTVGSSVSPARRDKSETSRKSLQPTKSLSAVHKSRLSSPRDKIPSQAKPVVTVEKTVESPKSPKITVIKNSTNESSSQSKTKSPLLRVSSKLLSSSVQALEALNKTDNGKSSTLGSPLSLIRKSSSRKLSRSSSNITRSTNAKSSKSDSQSVITSSGSETSSIIQIDQPPNKELIESYVCSVNDFDMTRNDDDVDDGVHSGKYVIWIVRFWDFFFFFW